MLHKFFTAMRWTKPSAKRPIVVLSEDRQAALDRAWTRVGSPPPDGWRGPAMLPSGCLIPLPPVQTPVTFGKASERRVPLALLERLRDDYTREAAARVYDESPARFLECRAMTKAIGMIIAGKVSA